MDYSSSSSYSSSAPKELLHNSHHLDKRNSITGFLDYSNTTNSFTIEASSNHKDKPHISIFSPPPPPSPSCIDPMRDLERGFLSSSSSINFNQHHHHHHRYHFHCHHHSDLTCTKNCEINLNVDSSATLLPSPSPLPTHVELSPYAGGVNLFGGDLSSQHISSTSKDSPFTRIDEEEDDKEEEIDDEEEEEEEKNDDDVDDAKLRRIVQNHAAHGNQAQFIGNKRAETPPSQPPFKKLIIKGQWTPQEDKLLSNLVGEHGLKNWSLIARILGGRVGKQCRERWHNHLKPHIKKEAWSKEEDEMLIQAHKEIGNKWAEIAKRLPGRSENTIKNHWNATKRRQFPSTRRNSRPSSSQPTSIISDGGAALKDYIDAVTSSSSKKPACEKQVTSMDAASNTSYDLNEESQTAVINHRSLFGYSDSEFTAGFVSDLSLFANTHNNNDDNSFWDVNFK